MSYEQQRPHIPAETRRQVITEAGHCCIVQHCNEHIVEFHHIDENRENNDPSNLAVLCDKHHKLAHAKIISKMDLRKYKELLSHPRNSPSPRSSEHDKKLLKEINEIFTYENILMLKNEDFGAFVQRNVIEPFFLLFHRSEDPLFRFTDEKLEFLRQQILLEAHSFMRHFSQRSAGLNEYYEYIDIGEISKTHPDMVDYWIKYSSDTVELAQYFCRSMLQLRAKMIEYL